MLFKLYYIIESFKYLVICYILHLNQMIKEEIEEIEEEKGRQESSVEKTLVKNIKEFYKNALEIEEKGDFNSSVTLFFKALAVLADLYIYKKEGKIPSSHTERFRILEKKYNNIYTIIDKDFLAYQDSYRTQLNKEDCEVLKQDAEKLLGILGINK